MTDFLTPAERSVRMASIRSKDTKPELLLRKALFREGFRYRLNVKRLPGKPDIVLPKYKTIILVNGCFWHGHSCQIGRNPDTNTDFWVKKIKNNRNRDARNIRQLRKLGWHVVIIWECTITTKKRFQIFLPQLIHRLRTY